MCVCVCVHVCMHVCICACASTRTCVSKYCFSPTVEPVGVQAGAVRGGGVQKDGPHCPEWRHGSPHPQGRDGKVRHALAV